MIDHHAEGDAGAGLLERRWFASMSAARVLEAECEALRELMECAEGAWRRARLRLVRLEAMRDALGEELAERDGRHRVSPPDLDGCRMSSAA